MQHDPNQILSILDACCDAFTFPMLDNGYVYPAATRLSAFRSPEDWALVIELFGFSPRDDYPSLHVCTFASKLFERQKAEDFVNERAYNQYLKNNPNNESEFFYPLEAEWFDEADEEMVPESAEGVDIDGEFVANPPITEYAEHGIELQRPPRVYIFELCRFLAATHRDAVLASSAELRVHVLPELTQVLSLDDWHHPDVVDQNCRPSNNEAFRQIALVLATGDPGHYRPTLEPNTHWSNWPEGGTL